MIIPPKLFTEARKDYDLCDVEALSKWTIELGLQYQPEVREAFERLVDIIGTQQFYKEFTTLYQYIMEKEQEKHSTFGCFEALSQPAPLTRTSSSSASNMTLNQPGSNGSSSAFKTLSEPDQQKKSPTNQESSSATSALLSIIPGKANIIKNYPSFAYRKYAKTPYTRHHSQPQFKADLRFSSPATISTTSSNSPRHLPLRGWQFRSLATDQTLSNMFQINSNNNGSVSIDDSQSGASQTRTFERSKTMPLPAITAHSALLPIPSVHPILKRNSADVNDQSNVFEFISSVQLASHVSEEAQTRSTTK